MRFRAVSSCSADRPTFPHVYGCAACERPKDLLAFLYPYSLFRAVSMIVLADFQRLREVRMERRCCGGLGGQAMYCCGL